MLSPKVYLQGLVATRARLMEDLEVWEDSCGNSPLTSDGEGREAGEDVAKREIAKIKMRIADIDANIDLLR